MEFNTSNYSHIGWVPCLCGKLFYKYTKCGLGKKRKKISLNHIGLEEGSFIGRIIISSVVDWKDEFHHDCVDENELTGLFRTVLVSSYNLDDDVIEGSVYLLQESFASTHFARVDNTIRDIRRKVRDREEIQEQHLLVIEQLDTTEADGFCKVEFLLNSKGFVLLRLANDCSSDVRTRDTIIRQAYYYIKYSWHKHRHHKDNAESLTTTHRLSDCDVSPHNELVNDLKNSLVQLKRDFHISDHQSLFHAKGITSYAKSLVESCNAQGWMPDEQKGRELLYFDNVSNSLHVSAEGIQRDLADRARIATNYRALLLFFLSIVAPLTIIFREDINEAVDASNLSTIKLMTAVVSSDTRLWFVWGALFLGYLVYKFVSLKFGTFFVAYTRVRDFMDLVVQEKYKAEVLSTITILIAVILAVYGIRAILTLLI